MKNYNEDSLLNIVKEIAKKNQFSDNIQISIQKGSEKCDGFMGEILAVDVADQNTQETLHLIAKISFKDEKYRNYTVIAEGYKNEILAYEKFFPAVEEMRRKLDLSLPIPALVKFYHSSDAEDQEIIIMENIKKYGFQMLPIRQLMGDTEVDSVFKQYAELHANSFALKALQPQKFEDIASQNMNVFRLMLDKKIAKNCVDHLCLIRDALKERGFEHVLLETYAKNTVGILRKAFDFSDEKYVCFLHGDSWSNNMMFRYKMENGQKKLSDIKLLDWQGWNIGPPVIDLMFCLYSSCSEEVFNNLEAHLNTYYEHLSKALAFYNLEVSEIYPFEELKRQLEIFYHFPTMFGIIIRKIRSSDEDHKIDPVSYSSEDDSTYFDAVLSTKYDEDYLLQNLKYVFDYIDNMTKKKYNII